MAFQLHIRQNIEAAGDHFGRDEVCRVDGSSVSVGSAPECTCRIDDPVFLGKHFTIDVTPADEAHILTPAPEAEIYLNDTPLTEPRHLYSGDVIRVGHWTLVFQRLYQQARRNRRFGLLGTAAKGFVALILISELLVVTVLPRWLYESTFWRQEVSRQRVARLLDQIARTNRKATDTDPMVAALRASIDAILAERSSYLSRYGSELSGSQHRVLYEELLQFKHLLQMAEEGRLIPDIPSVDLDSGVRAVLRANRAGDVDDRK